MDDAGILGTEATASVAPGWWDDEPTTADPTRAGAPTDPQQRNHPGRLALGMAVLAVERLGNPAGRALTTGVGVVVRTAGEARVLARRFAGPPADLAAAAAALASGLPGAAAARRTLARPRALLRHVTDLAREQGERTVDASRAEAAGFLRAGAAASVAWVQANAAAQIVDGLVPHLVAEVVPRIIEGAIPEVRNRVLPVVIEDLTRDPRVHELVMEQGRGVLGDAAHQLRATTAGADERLESAFRRLVRSPTAPEEVLEPTPAEVPLRSQVTPPPQHG